MVLNVNNLISPVGTLAGKALKVSPVLILLACLPGISIQRVQAQDAAAPVVKTAMEKGEMFRGESITYRVSVVNANGKRYSKPDLSSFEKDFQVTVGRDQAENTQSISFKGGVRRIVRTFSHHYFYALTPKRAGALVVPSPKVTVGGVVLSGPALRLNVVEPEKQDWVFLTVTARPNRVYPTRPFAITFQIAMRPLADDPNQEPVTLLRRMPMLSLPWIKNPPKGVEATGKFKATLQSVLDDEGHGFKLEGLTVTGNSPFSSFFPEQAVIRPKVKRVRRVGLDGVKRNYFIYELTLSYAASRPGEYTFGPAMLKGDFIAGIRGNNYFLKRRVIPAPAVIVTVSDPPNAPADFHGAIGRFQLRASVTPTKLRVGDPMTLELQIIPSPGSVALESIGPPDLKSQENLIKDFMLIDEDPVGEEERGRKIFRYSLRPKKENIELPAISMSYFDPIAEKFKKTSSAPIPLTVTAANNVGSADLVSGQRQQGANGDLRSASGVIRQNITDLASLRDNRMDIRLFILFPFILLISYSLLSVFVHRQRARSGDVALQRRQRAMGTADALLAQAQEDATKAPTLIRSAMLGLIADVANLPAAGMTPRDADSALTELGSGPDTRKDLSGILESLESMAYGGASSSDVATLSKQAHSLLVRIRKEIK